VNRAEAAVWSKSTCGRDRRPRGGTDPLIYTGDVVYVPRAALEANVVGYVSAPARSPSSRATRVQTSSSCRPGRS